MLLPARSVLTRVYVEVVILAPMVVQRAGKRWAELMLSLLVTVSRKSPLMARLVNFLSTSKPPVVVSILQQEVSFLFVRYPASCPYSENLLY